MGPENASRANRPHGQTVLVGESDNAKNLEFLIAGDEGRATESEWEHDTDEEHGARIVEWCRARGYECVSVALGASKSNPT